MTTEAAIEAFLAKHVDCEKLSDADAYQMLLEHLGDELLPGLLGLLKSPRPSSRAAAIDLLATRRPHVHHVAAAIAPLIRDANGNVMLTATDRLAEFPSEMVTLFLDDAYQMVLDHQDSEDVVPSIAAMRLCLRVAFDSYKEALLPRLLSMHAVYFGIEGYLLSLTLRDLGMAEE